MAKGKALATSTKDDESELEVSEDDVEGSNEENN